jgi:hypothetical protein
MGLMGNGSQTLADWVIQFAKVVGSSIAEGASGTRRPVQYRIVGLPGWDLTGDEIAVDENENNSETTDDADVYGTLGVTGRPLPPDNAGGVEEHAEVVCLRTADGLVPIAVRDVRLRMGGNAPNEGTMAFVGYGGGYHSISPVDNADLDKGSVHVIYCPYAFVNGAATKAHVITLDPTTAGEESITIVHAEGMAITMSAKDKKDVIIKNAAGDACIVVNDDGIKFNGNVICNGSLIVGNPATAVPLLAGILSPPSTMFYVSP